MQAVPPAGGGAAILERMQLALAEIASILSCAPPPVLGLASGYSIDSRSIRPGEVFFAIRGERFDGHDFVLTALGGGALAAVVEQTAYERYAEPFRNRMLAVPDTLAALQTLAAAVRRRWGKKIVAITGSAGKTTTKELTAQVLSSRYRVLKTEGNYNNHYGAALTLLRLTPVHELAVLELGMNHAGELTQLASIVGPQVAVFTNVGPVHLEFFGSIDRIADAKYELAAAIPAAGVLVLNQDDPFVRTFDRNFSGRVIRYGRQAGQLRGDATLLIDEVELQGERGSHFRVTARAGSVEETAHVHLPLLGAHNISNAAAALAAGSIFGVPLREGALALETMAAPPSRGQILHNAGVTVLDDCYNANPPAMKHMVQVLAGMPGKRRIVVAGEMLELGPSGADLHRECGKAMAEAGVDTIFAVRGLARYYLEGAEAVGFQGQMRFFEDAEVCATPLAELVQPGDVVLAKASRGVRLENALKGIVNAGAARH